MLMEDKDQALLSINVLMSRHGDFNNLYRIERLEQELHPAAQRALWRVTFIELRRITSEFRCF